MSELKNCHRHVSCGMRGNLFRALVLVLGSALPLSAATFNVTNTNNAGAGSLRQAINNANSNPGSTIQFASGLGTITPTAPLPAITANVTINGALNTVSGNNAFQVFFVKSGTVSINNITIANGKAQGGTSADNGGGAAGMGGGLLVNNGANVTISGVSFSSNAAVGGAGGGGVVNGGGGGGVGGNGGAPSGTVGGGGGNGGSSGNFGGTAGAGGTGSGNGGAGGNGAGGGGGNSSASGNGTDGGAGGFGGGGGGGAASGTATGGSGGAGGFGGGGGGGSSGPTGTSNGGAGGFGGGAGGGNAPNGGGGGGGAGLGGAVFVVSGGQLTVASGSISGNTVTGGAGGVGGDVNGSAGSGIGSGLFLNGTGTLTFSPGNGQLVNISDNIADQTGNGGTGGNAGSWALNVTATGTGVVALSGTNTYTGGTILAGGVLRASSATAMGTGTITFTGGTLQYGPSTTQDFSSQFSTGSNQLYNIATNGNNVTFATALTSSGGVLTKLGLGTLTLTGTSTYTGNTVILGDTLAIGASGSIANSSVVNLALSATTFDISGGGNQTIQDLTGVAGSTVNLGSNTLTEGTSNSTTFAGTLEGTGGGLNKIGSGTLTISGTSTYTGTTTISAGTLAAGSTTALSSSSAFTVNSTLDLNGFNSTIGSLAGSGNVKNSNGTTVTLDANGDNTSTTYSGTIANRINFSKSGTGTLTLSGTNSYKGTTTINAGTLAAGSTGGLSNNSDFTVTGTLDIAGFASNIGSLAGSGNVTNSGSTTTFATNGDDNSTTFSGTIGNGINLDKRGAGTLTLSGTNNYTGNTKITKGTLTAGSTSALSANSDFTIGGNGTLDIDGFSNTIQSLSGSGTITNSGSTASLRSGDFKSTTFSGTIGNGINFSKHGTGTLTLSGTNSYNGRTRVRNGTLAAGSTTGFSANSDFTVATAGTLDLAGFSNSIGSLSGSGVVTDSGTLASLTTNGDGNSTTFTGAITGSLNLIKDGDDTLTLSGTNTYTGGTSLLSGTLVLGSSSALGTGALTTFDPTVVYTNGITIANPIIMAGATTLEVDNADSATQSGTISETGGSQALTIVGTGTLTLSGTNTYTGGTTLMAGTLVLGNSSALGTGALTTFDPTVVYTNGITIANSIIMAGATTLEVDNADSATQSGVISETGGPQALTIAGTGTLTLSGTNTFTGGTTFGTGTVIAANASAFGLGTVTQNGGVLQTDNVNHTITMGNNFIQNNGTLFINLNGAPGSPNNDQVSVTGTAVLNGNLTINYTAGALGPKQFVTYTIVTTTDGITSINQAGYEPPAFQDGALAIGITGTVSGNNYDVILNAIQTPFTALPGTNFTPNQFNVASYLDRFDVTVSSGPVIPLLQALDGISVNPGALGQALDQLTPLRFQNFASTTAFNNASFLTQQFDNYLANHRGADGAFVSSNGGIDYSGLAVNNPEVDSGLQSVRSRLLAWSPAPSLGLLSDMGDPILGAIDMKDSKEMLSPAPTNLWNVFISGNVILAQDFSNSTAGLAGANATTGAVQIGADYKVTPHWLVGVAFGYGHTNATLDTFGSNASVNTYSPAVYASYSDSGWYANALTSYGFANYNQNRNVSIGAFNGTANSSPGGDQIVGNLDGGYDFHHHNWTYGPTLGLQYVHLDVDGYTETGLPGANLAVSEDSTDSLRSHLGWRISYAVHDDGLTFMPHISANWQHEYFNQSRGITSQFNGIGAGSFLVNTPNSSRNSALVDVGLDIQVNDALTAFVDYDVQAGQSDYFGQSVQGGFKIGF